MKRPLQHRPGHGLDLLLCSLLIAADCLDLGLHGVEIFDDTVLFVKGRQGDGYRLQFACVSNAIKSYP